MRGELQHERPRAGQPAGGVLDQPDERLAARRGRRSAPTAGSQSTTSRGSGSCGADVGRVGDDQVDGAARSSGRASNHEPSTSRTRVAARPSPARLALATASASSETSVAHTSTSGSAPRRSTARWRPTRCPDRRPPAAGSVGRRPAGRARPGRSRPPARSRAGGSGPAGRPRGRGCGRPTGRARTAAARPPGAGRPWRSRVATPRTVAGWSRPERVVGALEARGLLDDPPGARPRADWHPASARRRAVSASSCAPGGALAVVRQASGSSYCSWRLRSSATSASTTSSRSPARILSSL